MGQHTQTLEAVFVVYFRVLTRYRRSPLLPVVLEGIAKFAHMISVSYMGDLLEALKVLIGDKELSLHASLLAAVGAMEALRNHGAHRGACAVSVCARVQCAADRGRALHVCVAGKALLYDPKEFHMMVFARLHELQRPSRFEHAALALRCLYLMLVQSDVVSPDRVAAFVKRLLQLAVCWPAEYAEGALMIVRGCCMVRAWRSAANRADERACVCACHRSTPSCA